MMYNLVCENKKDESETVEMVRQALKFSEADPEAEPSKQQDVIEIRVHRIEHRQRLRQIEVGFGRAGLDPNLENSIQ